MKISTDIVLKFGEMIIDPNPENAEQMWPFLYGVAVALQIINDQLCTENALLCAQCHINGDAMMQCGEEES